MTDPTPSLLMKKSPAVNYDGLAPAVLAAMPVIGAYFTRAGLRALVTSACDSLHSQHSAHYSGRALDLRSWGVNNPHAFCNGLQLELAGAGIDGDFYVIWEPDHIHVEWVAEGEKPNIVDYVAGQFFYVKGEA